jgi:N12 class adenine-specific DNA methylase
MAEHKFEKLSFATSVDAIHISRRNATPHNIWFFCINNRWNANNLKGKCLKLISTFIQIALIEMVVREMFLFNIATP